MLAQRRQIGLLRAIGMTPAQVTGLLVAALPRARGARRAVRARRRRVRGRAAVGERGRRAWCARAPAAEPRAARGRARRSRSPLSPLATALPAWRAGRTPGPGRARARPRRDVGERLARRPARAAPAPAGGGRRRRQGRLRPARADDPHRLEPRARRCAGGHRDGLRGDDGPPRERPGRCARSPTSCAVQSSLPPAEVDRLLARRGEVTAVARVREIVMTGRGRTPRSTRGSSMARSRSFPYAIRDGRGARAPGEVTLGRGALDALGAQIGDRIALRAGGEPVSLRCGRAPRRARRRRPRRGHEPPTGCPPGPPGSTTPTGPCASPPGADPVATAAALARDGHGRLSAERPIESLAARGGRHAPGRLRHSRAADRDRGAQPADHARARRSASASATTPCSPRSARTPRQVRSVVIAGGAALAVPAAVSRAPARRVDLHARDRHDRPGRRPRRAHAAGPGGGIRSRSPARSRSPPRSARSPPARRRASDRRRRCGRSEPGAFPCSTMHKHHERAASQLLSAERRQVILDALARDGKVVAARLVEELGVSEDTVRRDLRELAALASSNVSTAARSRPRRSRAPSATGARRGRRRSRRSRRLPSPCSPARG